LAKYQTITLDTFLTIQNVGTTEKNDSGRG